MIISQKKKKIHKPQDIAEILYTIIEHEDKIDQQKEHFWVIGLNGNNVIVYIELATLGIANSSQVHPRETFRLAIQKGVVSIMVAHNHPSGNMEPSRSDRDITEQLIESGKILSIPVLDHIIISSENFDTHEYYSFHENKLI